MMSDQDLYTNQKPLFHEFLHRKIRHADAEIGKNIQETEYVFFVPFNKTAFFKKHHNISRPQTITVCLFLFWYAVE